MLRLNYSHDSNQCTTFTLPERNFDIPCFSAYNSANHEQRGGLCTCLKEHIMSINLRLKFTGVHIFGLPMKSFISVFFSFYIIYHLRMGIKLLYI